MLVLMNVDKYSEIFFINSIESSEPFKWSHLFLSCYEKTHGVALNTTSDRLNNENVVDLLMNCQFKSIESFGDIEVVVMPKDAEDGIEYIDDIDKYVFNKHKWVTSKLQKIMHPIEPSSYVTYMLNKADKFDVKRYVF